MHFKHISSNLLHKYAKSVLLSLCQCLENQTSEKLSNLPEVTQLVKMEKTRSDPALSEFRAQALYTGCCVSCVMLIALSWSLPGLFHRRAVQ